MSLYCEDPVPIYEEDLCESEPGRIIAVAYLRTDATITDYTSAAQWAADVAAGRAAVIRNVRGEKPKSSQTEVDGFGREDVRTTGRKHNIVYESPDVIDNVDYYNAMNFNSSYRVAYYTQSGHVWVVEEAIANVDADYVILSAIDSDILWNVEVKWSSKALALPYVAPASIFEITA